jgi:hypothetical protein
MNNTGVENNSLKEDMSYCTAIETMQPEERKALHKNYHDNHYGFPIHDDGLVEALGSLLPEAQGEDYEELDFANKMKKKRKRQRGQK